MSNIPKPTKTKGSSDNLIESFFLNMLLDEIAPSKSDLEFFKTKLAFQKSKYEMKSTSSSLSSDDKKNTRNANNQMAEKVYLSRYPHSSNNVTNYSKFFIGNDQSNQPINVCNVNNINQLNTIGNIPSNSNLNNTGYIVSGQNIINTINLVNMTNNINANINVNFPNPVSTGNEYKIQNILNQVNQVNNSNSTSNVNTIVFPGNIPNNMNNINNINNINIINVSNIPNTSPPLSPSPSAEINPSSDLSRNQNQNYETDLPLTKKGILTSLATQKATKILQEKIKLLSPSDLTALLNTLKGLFVQIMINRNGNYLCSDLFKSLSQSQRVEILLEIFNYIEQISINEFGTHSMQTLVEVCKTEKEIVLLLTAVSNISTLLNMAFNPNGSFVIQKILIKIPENYRTKLNYLLLGILPNLAVDTYGVVVAKYLIQYSFDEKLIGEIIKCVVNNFALISQNKFGNYLIQFIVSYWWNVKEMVQIKNIIQNSFYQLSINQFSSHISKCFIQHLNNNEKQNFLNYLLQNGMYNALANDKYGIFVINKLNNSLQNINNRNKKNDKEH